MKFQEFEDKMKELTKLQSKIWTIQRILEKAQSWNGITIKHYDGHTNEVVVDFSFLKNGLIEAFNLLVNKYNKIAKSIEDAGVELENPYKDVKPIPNLALQLGATQYKLRELEEKHKKLEEALDEVRSQRDEYYKKLEEIWRNNGNNN